ncbi:MAG TPA: SpoIID/LytB domain-containing protein, partial [Flavobacteriales bacterium]|nr:SpoIID/LytB domain-containing protein [Flavobacteriales bacterium]
MLPLLRYRLLILFTLLAMCAAAQTPSADREMRVALFVDRPTKQVMVMTARSTCSVWADGVRKGELKANDGLRIEVATKGITARSLSFTVQATRIELVPAGGHGFRMKPLDRKDGERTYPGVLEVSNVGGRLQLIDRLPLEAYTAGVVSAEAGKEHHIEYYKLQAVSCRTYALTNMRKHAPEGFELCDGVHCQVFKGKNWNDSIQQAVDATHGLVIVDPDIKLI